jgi:hypothetical protein
MSEKLWKQVSLPFGRHLQREKKLKKLRNEKGKDDRPIWLQEKYKISSAAYHGGDLNGFCCRSLLADGMKIFAETRIFNSI